MWEKIKYYVIVGTSCLCLGVGASYLVTQGAADKRIDKLKSDLARSEVRNEQLGLRLSAATGSEQRLEQTVSRFQDDNSRLNESLGRAEADASKLKDGLERVANSMQSAGKGLDAIIEGLGQLKELAELLP